MDLGQFSIFSCITVGFIINRWYSTRSIKRLSLSERKLVVMPNEIKDVLVGILLGDGHINQRSSTGNSRFIFGQTSKHKEYFDYVFSIFKLFCTDGYEPKLKSIIDKRNNVTYYSFSFCTMQLPCFNIFRELFYVSNVKIVPYNIYDLLTAKGLAF